MPKSKLLIKNGHVVDPASGINEITDILVENGCIAKIAKNISTSGAKTINASKKIVMPALIDMHVHLREPGRGDKETVASGTMAALKGGITTVLSMPNTQPAIDCIEQVKVLKNIIKEKAHADVFISAAITKQRAAKELTDIATLKGAGILAITDDGSSIDSDDLMREALKKAKENNILVICHCEDKTLSKDGVVNLGFTSTRLGLRGISKESEYRRVKRDIELAQEQGARAHIAHVSCKESVELIAKAKKKGSFISAETAPHYFTLTEEAVLEFDTNKKMNPPLRSQEDLESIKRGLKNGTIDVIASDHAPHTENEKDIEFDRAEFGVIGLETELAVAITQLIKTKVLDWPQLVEKLALNPAKILGIDKGALKVGSQADIIVVDADKEWVVEKESIVSKSKNSAFLDQKLKGIVQYTIYKGQVAYSNNTD